MECPEVVEEVILSKQTKLTTRIRILSHCALYIPCSTAYHYFTYSHCKYYGQAKTESKEAQREARKEAQR
jgi:hypothetical protein